MAEGEKQHPANTSILLAEDHPDIRKLVRAMLSRHGYCVIDASNGREALELSRGYPGRIDLLLTNVTMPEIDGVELAGYIRRERPETRILIMSGHSSGVLTDLLKNPDFIRKPFLPEELMDRIKQALSRPSSAHEPEEV